MSYAYVGQAQGNSGTNVTSFTLTYSPTAGNLILIAANYVSSSTKTVTSVTDQSSNAIPFQEIGTGLYDGGTEIGSHLLVLSNVPSGITSIKVTFNTTITFGIVMQLIEYSGLAISNPWDPNTTGAKLTSTVTNTSNGVVSGNITNNNQPAMLFGTTVTGSNSAPLAGTSPISFTGRTGFNWASQNTTIKCEDALITTTGSAVQATFTSGTSASTTFLTIAVVLDLQPPPIILGAPLSNPGPGISPNSQQQFTEQLAAANFSPVIPLTGVTGTGSVGTVTAPNVISLTGVSSTGTVGTVVATPQIAISGISATGSVGSITPSLTINLLGIANTAATGIVVPCGGTPVGPGLGVLQIPGPGLSSPYNLNQFIWGPVTHDLPPNTSGSGVLTGVSATGSVGNVGTQNSGGGGPTLTGVSATGGVGTVVPSSSVGVTGNQGSSALGTVIAYSSISITGVSVSGSPGSLFPPATSPLTGVQALGQVGSVLVAFEHGITMPNVVGLNYYMALLALQEVGIYDPQSVLNFNQTSIAVAWAQSTAAPGIVVAQSVSQGTKIPAGTKLTLTVAEFPFGSVIDSPPDWKQRF